MLNDLLKSVLIIPLFKQFTLSCETGLRQSTSRFLPAPQYFKQKYNLNVINNNNKIVKKAIFLIQICTTKYFFLILLQIQSINYLLISHFLFSATQANYSHKFISEMLWGIIQTFNYDKIKLQIRIRKSDPFFFPQGTCGKNLKENHRK